uniref:Glycosyltransferase family 92 protein n=1 Tax=Panagrolaimus davidi TaxID=227884 RepID=A0A914Q9L4_9BILA
MKEHLPIVSCVSSLFYAERWQIVAMSIEWYSYFGVSRQAYYVLSAMIGIHELLKAYDRERIIDLHYWSVPNIPELDSRLQLSTRDLAGSLNDCYLKYREAADFIIVHDVDDLIYIKHGSQFYPPLKQLWQENPLARSLNFSARTVEMESEKRFEQFSMLKSFNSMNILPDSITGKSIYNTSLIESVWIHWPTEYDRRLKSVTWNENNAILIHARNFNFGKYSNSDNRDILQETILDSKHAQKINENFENRKFIFESNKYIKEMESSMRYYSNIDECTLSIGGYDAKIFGCRSHYFCKIPRFPGIYCIESRQNYVKHVLTPFLTFYISQKSPSPTLNKNGCSL